MQHRLAERVENKMKREKDAQGHYATWCHWAETKEFMWEI